MPTRRNPKAGSPNKFVSDLGPTAKRTRSEAAIERVRLGGGVFVEAVRATRMPMIVTDPNLPGDPIVFANPSFLDLSGYTMEEVLGQQAHFLNGAGTDPNFRRALEEDRDDTVETVQYRKDGSRFIAAVFLSAFKDDARRTVHHFLSFLDVTRRVAAEEKVQVQTALRESEEKYRTLFRSIDEGFCIVEVIFDEAGKAVDYVFLEANPAFERQTGLVGAIGKRMRELRPDHEEFWFQTYGRIALTGQAERFEHRAEALGRWYNVYAFRVGVPEDRRVAILFDDISKRKRAEEALRESEGRHSFLLALGDAMRPQATASGMIEVAARYLGERLNASRVLYAEFDQARGVADIFNGWFADGAQPFPTIMRLEDYEGPVLDDLRAGRTVRIDNVGLLVDHPAYAAIAEVGVQALLSVPLIVGGRLMVNLSVHQHEARHWTDEEVALVQEVAESLWAEIVRARAEAAQRESEQRARLLLAELQHRVRNTLAVVRSIARRTADRSDTIDQMIGHFEGRLNAFSRVQSAVTRTADSGVDIKAIAEDELLAVATREGRRLKISGPEVCLKPKAAESISLAFHELATNSVKHGALSAPKGRVRVGWDRVPRDGTEELRLEWVEAGLDAPPKPAREGFGHEMLLRTLPYDLQAETGIEFTGDGIRFTMRLPLRPDVLAE